MELKPTTRVAEALAHAQRFAQQGHHPEIAPAHLTLALMALADTATQELLAPTGASVAGIQAQAQQTLAGLPTVSGTASQPPTFGRDAVAVLTQADTLMKAKGDSYLAADLLLLALAETGHLGGVDKGGAQALEAAIDTQRGGRKVTSETPAEGGESLEKYGTDLTQAARDGKLDPVIGRDQ